MKDNYTFIIIYSIVVHNSNNSINKIIIKVKRILLIIADVVTNNARISSVADIRSLIK